MILIVDDNPADQELLRLSLQEGGIDTVVHTAFDGKQGCALLLASERTGLRYALVVVDLNMPRMDGRALLRWIRSQDSMEQTPVVVLTSSHAPVDRKECLQLGANDYFIKPSDYDGFHPIIAAWKRYLS